MPTEVELTVGQFVAVLNQTLEYTLPSVVVVGELAKLRVSKNRWVYFDLKDDDATVKFFGTVYQLPGPLEDGMLLKVRGQPKLHNLYGFSVNVQSIQPAGEGSIRKAADLLQAKLTAEGLFDEDRKRPIPYPPTRIGLITSRQSAAYADFVKVLGARWGGLHIDLIDVQVQGEVAPQQIVAALEHFNSLAEPPEVLILIRGGGSAEDLAAFSTEQVTRAVAASRVPTLVAIGHEIDLSLAELAADRRASTPSNAAELLVPDRRRALHELQSITTELQRRGAYHIRIAQDELQTAVTDLDTSLRDQFSDLRSGLKSHAQLLEALNPAAILRRGYAIVRQQGKAVRSQHAVNIGDIVNVQLADGSFGATVSDKGDLNGKG
jgi:exodeoxyribonuclease VII large subunit